MKDLKGGERVEVRRWMRSLLDWFFLYASGRK